jgi:type I restriction enzyme, S subunit
MRELVRTPSNGGWTSTTLDQVASCTLGGTPSTAVPQFWGGEVPWMASGDVHLRRVHDVPGRITPKGLAASNATLVSPPAVAVGLAGQGKTRGSVALTLCKLSTNQSIALLRGDEARLTTEFLFHNLDHRYEELRAKSAGGGRGGLSKEILGAIPIDLPSLGEQLVITEILGTLDTTIHQTLAIIEKLKQVKQGLLHDLLTRGIGANGELRPLQSQAPHLYKDSPLGWIPLNWDVMDLENLLSDDDPAMRSGPFGSALLKHELVASGVPLLGIDNVHVERFDGNFSRFVSEKKFYELDRYAVRPHDLMITIMGTVGRCCVVPEGIGRALSSKHTWTVTLDRAKYCPLLAMLQINYCEWALRQFAKDEQGGVMSAIRSETLRKLLLPTPPIAEQGEIELRMRAIDSRIDVEGAVLRKLLLQRAGLMDDLITGSVRVTPLLADALPL